MLPTSTNKVVIRLAIIFIFVVCASCKAETPYYVKNYLNDLSTLSGIGNDEDINVTLQNLREWEIIDEEDINCLNDKLDYLFLTRTISKFTGLDNKLSALSDKGWISTKALPRQKVSYEVGQAVIRKAVEYRNDMGTDVFFDVEYQDNVVPEDEVQKEGDIFFSKDRGSYQYYAPNDDGGMDEKDAEFDQVFKTFELNDGFEVDFSNAEVIPYEPDEESEVYVNTNFQLLSSKSHSFRKSGFAVSYSLSSSGVSLHISKNVDKVNFYSDIEIYSVKPKIKWKSQNGDVKNCFFDVEFKSTEKIGMSIGRYKDYYLKFKDLDSSSFVALLDSMIESPKDHVEATFPICKVKTPIPNIPTAFLNLDIMINMYASGKMEAVLYNAHEIGFETVNGNIRTISNHTNKLDGDIGGSAKAALGVNISLETAGFTLADVEVDGGLRGKVKSTMHLYNENGKQQQIDSEYDYSTLQDLSKGNNDVKVCGDISLSWLFDVTFNTYRTKLYDMGFSREFSVLDENDQVFGNLHHIENGMFVKKCTRNDKPVLKQNAIPIKSNKIVLSTYAEVLLKNETIQISVDSLPEGYQESQLQFESSDSNIATVNNGIVTGKNPGSCRIKVFTSDRKYASYINILVSTG